MVLTGIFTPDVDICSSFTLGELTNAFQAEIFVSLLAADITIDHWSTDLNFDRQSCRNSGSLI